MGRSLLSLIASLFVVTPLIAHDLPDGQVERAVQVTAYPDRIEVQYQFGLSERTMWQELHGAGGAKDAEIGDLGREELAALEAEYLAKVSSELPKRIELILAGELQESPSVTTEMIYQHHLQFEFRLVYPCTVAAEPCFFELTDQNFATFPGHYRVAIRGRGGREALSDTAALLLVRAPRLPIQSERLGRLVVPPIQATVGKDLASGGSRVVRPISPRSIGGEEGSSAASTSSSSRALPNWLVGGFILVVAILCLPLLFLKRRSVGT